MPVEFLLQVHHITHDFYEWNYFFRALFMFLFSAVSLPYRVHALTTCFFSVLSCSCTGSISLFLMSFYFEHCRYCCLLVAWCLCSSWFGWWLVVVGCCWFLKSWSSYFVCVCDFFFLLFIFQYIFFHFSLGSGWHTIKCKPNFDVDDFRLLSFFAAAFVICYLTGGSRERAST